MTRAEICLAAVGVIGVVTAAIHGVIMQRRMIAPLSAHLEQHRVLSSASRALVAPLLHVSTLAWAVAGVALAYAAVRGTTDLQRVTAATAFIIFGYAAVANALAVRGLHPGWMLMGLATLLIAAAYL